MIAGILVWSRRVISLRRRPLQRVGHLIRWQVVSVLGSDAGHVQPGIGFRIRNFSVRGDEGRDPESGSAGARGSVLRVSAAGGLSRAGRTARFHCIESLTSGTLHPSVGVFYIVRSGKPSMTLRQGTAAAHRVAGDVDGARDVGLSTWKLAVGDRTGDSFRAVHRSS
jgi:hypothetical protein